MVISGKPSFECMDGNNNGHLQMERITAFINHNLENFASQWEKWVNYVTPHRPDFIFTTQ